MDNEHKAALERGRQESRKISAYLKHLEAGRQRGPSVDPAKIEAEIEKLNREMSSATPIQQLSMIQRRLDLTEKLATSGMSDVEVEDLEAGFLEAVASYSERKGISYAAWREIGVPAKMLRRGGIQRS